MQADPSLIIVANSKSMESGIVFNGTHLPEDLHIPVHATASLLDDEEEEEEPNMHCIETQANPVSAGNPSSEGSGMKTASHEPQETEDQNERLPSSSLQDQQQILRHRLVRIRAERRSCQIRQRQCDGLEQKLQTTLAIREQKQHRLSEDWLRHRNASEIALPHWNVTASDAFSIVCEQGHAIASINGLRLGAVVPARARMNAATIPAVSNPPSTLVTRALALTNTAPTPVTGPLDNTSSGVLWHTIPWLEINAALGQVALLLAILEQSLQNSNAPPFRYAMLCRGSTSQIGLRPSPGKVATAITWYNLFYSEEGTFHLMLFAKKRNFDAAMHCLLSCVEEARTIVQARDRTVVVPYEMKSGGGTICGLPVAFFSGTNPETWTRAMKYLLTNLKHFLSFRGVGLWNNDTMSRQSILSSAAVEER